MSRTEQVNFINTWTGFSKLVNGMYIHVCSLLILEVHVYIQDISAADQSNYSSCDLMTFSLEIGDTLMIRQPVYLWAVNYKRYIAFILYILLTSLKC